MKRKTKNRSLSVLLIAALVAATVVPQWDGSISALSTVRADYTVRPLIWNGTSVVTDSDPAHEVTFNQNQVLGADFNSLTAGNYYLDSNISNSNRGITINGDVNLDLNGKTLAFGTGTGPAFYIDGGTLSIFDSGQGGVLDGGTNQNNGGDPVEVHNKDGGCIRIANNGTLNIYGGTIKGVTLIGGGGCILTKYGKVNLFAGNLIGASETSSAGCISVGQMDNGANNPNCVLNMYGGSVDGKAKYWGGAIRVVGTANIWGGTIKGVMTPNTNDLKGGGICLDATSSGTISSGTVNMRGGTITGCSAATGGGVYGLPGTTLSLSGSAKITGNTVNGSPNNIYLQNGQTITVNGNYTGQAGVTVQDHSVGRVLTSGFTNNSDAAALHFISDNSSYQINKANGEAILSDTSDAPAPEPTPTPSDSGGSSSSSSSSGSSSSSDSSAPAATNAKPSAGGETKVTDASGKAITNSLVTVKVTDASGNTVSKQVLTDESGNIAKKEVVTVTQQVSSNGKKTEVEKTYLAASDGTIYDKPGFTEVESVMGLSAGDISSSDTVVFINEDGSLKQSEKFTVTTKSGKKVSYAVDDNCNVIRNGFFNAKKTGTTEKSIKSGASYFAGSNGQIITKALFTVKTTKSGKVKVKINKKGSLFSQSVTIEDIELYVSLKGAGLKNKKGEQYYATASGKIAKDKWVNVGLKEYYCGSNGKITKSR